MPQGDKDTDEFSTIMITKGQFCDGTISQSKCHKCNLDGILSHMMQLLHYAALQYVPFSHIKFDPFF